MYNLKLRDRYIESIELGLDSEENYLKMFLRNDVDRNLPDDFGEYMDFALEAAKRVPNMSSGLLKRALDISDKYFSPDVQNVYFSPEFLNNEEGTARREIIFERMDDIYSLGSKVCIYNPDEKSILQRVDKLEKNVITVGGYYLGRFASKAEHESLSEKDIQSVKNILPHLSGLDTRAISVYNDIARIAKQEPKLHDDMFDFCRHNLLNHNQPKDLGNEADFNAEYSLYILKDIVETNPQYAKKTLELLENISHERVIGQNGDIVSDLIKEIRIKAGQASTNERIAESKERMLNHRAEKEAAIKRYKENKNKKFYTFDDLEFNMSESNNVPTAKMMFDNGWGIEVRNDLYFGSDEYVACILDKSGKSTEDTALNIVEDRDENGISETIRHFPCDMTTLNKLMKDVQKLDKNGNLPPEYSEAENVVSGVVVADEIAKRIIKENEYKERNRKEYISPEERKKYLGGINYEITPEVGKKLSDAIKRQYLMNKKQKG